MTIPQTLRIAVQHHQAGRLAEAEALYRQILAVQPHHFDALHLLGVTAHQVGRDDLAVEWIRRAILLSPNFPAAHCNLGEAYRTAGRFEEAVAACHRALQLEPNYPDALTCLCAALAAQGQYEEAVAPCRRALQLKPDYPAALNNLGNILAAQGQHDGAIAAYRRVLELEPGYVGAHNNLGVALVAQGHYDDAVAAYRRALEIEPGYVEAHNNLGVALRERGQIEESIAACRRALRIKPDYPEALNNLGIALKNRGELDEAIAAYRQALQLKPDFPEAHINLGAALATQGRFDEAIAAYRRALQLKSDYPEAHMNLGLALRERGQPGEAIAAFRHALLLKPDDPEALNNLGAALAGQNMFDDAIAQYRHALQLKPDYAEAHNNLGATLKDQGKLEAAIDAYRLALELKPDYAEAFNNLGAALTGQGLIDEAIDAYHHALQIKPEYTSAHSGLIFALHYHSNLNERTLSEEHKRWNRQFSDPVKPFLRPHANNRDPERRLRIGYVSPDFREHVVGRFALPLLKHHDREQVEIFCYSGVSRPDWMTERFRALGARWRNATGVPDARLAEMIREDEVDILVDLAMHSANNRLPVFARQPAPVQVTWLAYPGSTGLREIGYRLTDAYMDQPGERTLWSAEEPVRLPDCWCCYEPADDSPEVHALPALSAEGVTFGSLNNFAKVHEQVLARWARVLEAVKGSRLLMFCPEGRTRDRVREFLGARGIAAERVELVDFLPPVELLRLYQRIDLALDPFPFNGMTTTCDALWMGTPVLTLPGTMPVSRAGLSILSNVGLAQFAASSEEDYVRMAVAIARDLPRLADLRATLRSRMRASPLMDAPRFARNVESAYRSIWQAWRQHE